MPHDHTPGRAGSTTARLGVALGVAVVVLAVQVAGGLLTGSLALLADSAHVAADAGGLALVLTAAVLAARPATSSRTFGWARLEVLAAVVNALLLGGASLWVALAALSRLRGNVEVEAGGMVLVATIGLVGNAVSLRVLARAPDQGLGVRAASLEVLADLVGSVAVIVAAGLVALTGSSLPDALVGLGIAAVVLPRAWRLLTEALLVLLEATPPGVDLEQVRAHLMAAEGVLDVHDLHAWSISSGLPVVSAHVVVESDRASGPVLDALGLCLADDFDVRHCTFQLEPAGHAAHEADSC